MAQGLAAAGARVILNGTDAARVQAAVDEMRAAGFEAEGAAFNVTDEPAILQAFEGFDRRGVVVDILVNNAGIQLRKPLVELSTAEWRQVIETNLTSAFVIGREAGRRMVARGHGKIINIGSLTSQLARATVAPLQRGQERPQDAHPGHGGRMGGGAASGIQANAIGPGYMLTDMNEALISNPAFDAWVKGRAPARRWGLPEELAGVAVFLASPASNYVNGQILYVDGGFSAVL